MLSEVYSISVGNWSTQVPRHLPFNVMCNTYFKRALLRLARLTRRTWILFVTYVSVHLQMEPQCR